MAHEDWSYSPKQETPKDQVRFLIGDTDEANAFVYDSEIYAALKEESENIYRAGARIADGLYARFIRLKARRGGGVQQDLGKVADEYKELACSLRARAAGKSTNVFIMPSMSVSEKAANASDASLVQPFFSRGMHNNPGVSTGLTDD